MTRKSLTSFFFETNGILLIAAAISIVFSFIVLLHQQPTNGDAIFYINAAQTYGSDGLKAALNIYGWPFFSILIFYTVKILNISYLNAGLLLNTIFITALVFTFISTIKVFGGSYRHQLAAAIVILTCHYLNHFRDDILRDTGYYFFALLSVLYLVYYARSLQWRHAILWNIVIIFAILFRIEGIVFATFAPLIILCKPGYSFTLRFYHFIKLYSVPCLLAVIFLIYAHMLGSTNPMPTSRLDEIVTQLFHGLSKSITTIQWACAQLKEHVLGTYGQHDAITILIFGTIGIFVTTLFSNLGIVNSALSAHGLFGRYFKMDWSAKSVFYIYIILNCAVCMLFISQLLFLSTRYIFFLSLLLLLPATFSIIAIFDHWRLKRRVISGKPLVFILMILGIFYNLIAGLGHFGVSKTYIVQAGQWIDNNTPKTSTVYVNDTQIILYSSRAGKTNWKNMENFIASFKQKSNAYDYVAVNVKHQNKNVISIIENQLPLKKLEVFANKRGDSVIIYQRVNEQ